MLHRFANVLYIFLHLPLLYLPFVGLQESRYWEYLNVNTYEGICVSNNEPVVLQGTTDGTTYQFTDTDIDYGEGRVEETLRFYCSNYDEAQRFIDLYRDSADKLSANQAFWDFRESAVVSPYQNYRLQVVNEESDYFMFWNGIFSGVTYMVIYYVVIQVIRIIYQYIVFGVFVWHPYRKAKKIETD